MKTIACMLLVSAALVMTTPVIPPAAYHVRPRIVVVFDGDPWHRGHRLRRRRHYRRA